MANSVPVPRSREQILGEGIDIFLSKVGVRRLKVGGPILSFLETSAQSDFRSAEDFFGMLASTSLEDARGVALDRIGQDEDVPRPSQSPASGFVDVGDSTFAKISTKVFQGVAAPIVGTTTLSVADASAFSASGSVYLGRGTSNYEGPISYTSKTNLGTYWVLNLASGTLRFHNLNETVVLAQGGLRQIPAGQVVQTPQGNAQDAVRFKVLYGAQLPDGEVLVEGVQVVAVNAGLGGNVSATAISQFSPNPFFGATVSNPLPLNNGQPTMDDDSYVELIRDARGSRSRGTPLAIQTFAVGVTSQDDDRRVTSASVVRSTSGLATLYVDDGTGYEEPSAGVAIEQIFDSALGGETTAKVASQPPVTKAFVASMASAPFALASGAKLAFEVGGVVTEHTFSADEFAAISNATGYEVSASVNADSGLLWGVRTLDDGTRLAAFAKADQNESIQVIAASSSDANDEFLFPTGRVDTMRLYKNDRLLSKDGLPASVSSRPTSFWTGLTGSQTLSLIVDGVSLAFDGTQFPAFTGTDFIAAGTGFSSVGANTPAAWAAVFSYRIPGITATVVAGAVVLTSNRGRSATARVAILGGTLVSNGMFLLSSSTGANSDYELNRNTGELELAQALAIDDQLSCGSASTRAFVQSSAFTTATLGSPGRLWFSFDGAAALVSTGITTLTLLDVTNSSPAWGKRTRLTSSTATALFSQVRVADWMIPWDASLVALGFLGAYRVSAVDAAGTWVEIATKAGVTPSAGVALVSAGLSFVRSPEPLQLQLIAAGTNYTSTSIVAALTGLAGATASVYKTTAFRVATNTFDETEGAAALVAADAFGLLVPLAPSSAATSLTGHLGSVESGSSEVSVPDLHQAFVSTDAGAAAPQLTWSPDPQVIENSPSAGLLVGLRALYDAATIAGSRWATQQGFRSPILSVTSAGGNLFNTTIRQAVETTWVQGERCYVSRGFQLASDDQLVAVVDGDEEQKRFVAPMWRTLKPVGSTYASTNTYKDADNGNASLVTAFGLTQDFNDFAVYMAARGKSDAGDANREVLWRWKRLGPDGNLSRVRYVLPAAENAAVAATWDDTSSKTTDVSLSLAGGALTTGIALRTGTHVGLAKISVASGMTAIVWLLGFAISSASRTTNVDTLTLTMPAGVVAHGIPNGSTIYVASNNVNFASGAYTLTGTTGTTLSYTETAPDVGATPNIGTVSFDTLEATLAAASPAVGAGQFFRINDPAAVPAPFIDQTARILTSGPQFVTASMEASVGTATTPTWYLLNDPAALKVFANPTQTTTVVVAAANALINSPVSLTVTQGGTGLQDRSSAERAASSPTWFSLSDGVNHVRTTAVVAGDYQLTFKSPITAGLGSNSDWANEVVKVVPRTAKNVVDWLSTPAVSGLFSAASVQRSAVARKVQIATLTAGSGGGVHVQGGTANGATAAVVGSATAVAAAYAVVPVKSADAQGFCAGQLVSVDNAELASKAVFDTASSLDSVSVVGTDAVYVLNSGGTPAWTASATASPKAAVVIERQGAFVSLSDTGLGQTLSVAGAAEGDWLRVASTSAPLLGAAYQVASGNVGSFRIVKVVAGIDGHAGSIWIENPNVVEQDVAECDIQMFTSQSLQVGDSVSISYLGWGTGNQGSWVVSSVGDAGGGAFTNRFTFKLAASGRSPTVIGAPLGALGANSPLIAVTEPIPTRLVSRIVSVGPSPTDSTLVDLKLSSDKLSSKIGASYGSVVSAFGKLAFQTSASQGIDGYAHSTGLIGETNRVEYGDPADTATYPGVVAAGAVVNIFGPLVKRIRVSLSVRLRTGAKPAEVAAAVRNAVARVVNSGDVGQPISISALLRAASKVGGVFAVAVISPAYGVGNDLISVQPNERPLVLNLNEDVQVAFVGA